MRGHSGERTARRPPSSCIMSKRSAFSTNHTCAYSDFGNAVILIPQLTYPETLVHPAVPLDELSPPVTSLCVLLQQCTQKGLALFRSLDVAAASQDFMHTDFRHMCVSLCVCVYVCVCVCVCLCVCVHSHRQHRHLHTCTYHKAAAWTTRKIKLLQHAAIQRAGTKDKLCPRYEWYRIR